LAVANQHSQWAPEDDSKKNIKIIWLYEILFYLCTIINH
jgi:hypothetical protein